MTRNTELLSIENVQAWHAEAGADLRRYSQEFKFADLALSLAAQLQQEREARERMEKALEWYAEPSIYQQEHFEGTGMEYPALVDGGHSARLALTPEVAQ